MRKFFHIGFYAKERPPKFEDLKAVLDKALDWVMYAPNCCIVLTSSEANVWYHRLKPLLHDEDLFFIFEIDFYGGHSLVGFLPEHVWAWIRKHTNQTITPIAALPKPDS